ncbi:hypothetical protein FRC00_009749 [Tulasnella sp. 408]|nr:hypothetical protein FRC00_009749 [Tulasnella sp. 408]
MSSIKKLSPAIKELRFLMCQNGQASAGARQFIQTAYPYLKKHNPDLPVLIREARGTPARAFARFGTYSRNQPTSCQSELRNADLTPEYGVEKHVELDNLSTTDVQTKVTELLNAPPPSS